MRGQTVRRRFIDPTTCRRQFELHRRHRFYIFSVRCDRSSAQRKRRSSRSLLASSWKPEDRKKVEAIVCPRVIGDEQQKFSILSLSLSRATCFHSIDFHPKRNLCWSWLAVSIRIFRCIHYEGNSSFMKLFGGLFRGIVSSMMYYWFIFFFFSFDFVFWSKFLYPWNDEIYYYVTLDVICIEEYRFCIGKILFYINIRSYRHISISKWFRIETIVSSVSRIKTWCAIYLLLLYRYRKLIETSSPSLVK